MRRLIVWRHGETAHNAGGIWQGQLDTELSDRGRHQARASADALAQLRPERIVSSDLRRAAATAEALGERCGTPVEYDARLREIDAGAWQGLSQGDVAERYPDAHAALARGEDVVRGEHGESVAQVQQRAGSAVREVIDRLGAAQLAVVATHGVTAKTLVAHLVGMDHRTAWLTLAGLHNCHWAELGEYRTGWRITAWNVGVTGSVTSTSDR